MHIQWSEHPAFRFWAWLFLPGHTVFILWIVIGPWMLYGVNDADVIQANKQLDIFIGSFFSICAGIYFLAGAYQVMLHDIRKLFIVKKLAVEENGKVSVNGYYLKQGNFLLEDIETVRIFRIEGHWYKRVHSLFYRAMDHYRLDLKDGRQFCFQGSNKKVKAMLKRLYGPEIIDDLPENWDL